jgi:glutathione S-transferase
MPKLRLFGAAYSVYVRTVRLALIEKAIVYEQVPIDVFAVDGVPLAYFERHPFGRIPALEHGDFRLYETGAMTRYIDDAFDGPALQPQDVRARARMNQIISIADGYVYPNLVLGVYVEQVSKPARNEKPDIARLDAALQRAPLCLRAISDLAMAGPWLCGPAISLADFYLAPMLHYFMQAPVAAELLHRSPSLAAWWQRIAERECMRGTLPEE